MAAWINVLAEQIREGKPLREGEHRDGILPTVPVLISPVYPTWHNETIFAAGQHFYRRPPMPMLQMIWPDRHGRFPTEPDAGERCQTDQPRLWLPKEDHPPGVWTRLDEPTESPFPDVSADERVLATLRVLEGATSIVGVAHTSDGEWEFLDGEPIRDVDDIAMTHLRHLITDHPHIVDLADLPRGYQAWQQPDGSWSREPLEPDMD